MQVWIALIVRMFMKVVSRPVFYSIWRILSVVNVFIHHIIVNPKQLNTALEQLSNNSRLLSLLHNIIFWKIHINYWRRIRIKKETLSQIILFFFLFCKVCWIFCQLSLSIVLDLFLCSAGYFVFYPYFISNRSRGSYLSFTVRFTERILSTFVIGSFSCI